MSELCASTAVPVFFAWGQESDVRNVGRLLDSLIYLAEDVVERDGDWACCNAFFIQAPLDASILTCLSSIIYCSPKIVKVFSSWIFVSWLFPVCWWSVAPSYPCTQLHNIYMLVLNVVQSLNPRYTLRSQNHTYRAGAPSMVDTWHNAYNFTLAISSIDPRHVSVRIAKTLTTWTITSCLVDVGLWDHKQDILALANVCSFSLNNYLWDLEMPSGSPAPAGVLCCFQATLFHGHSHDTRHRLHAELLHCLCRDLGEGSGRHIANHPWSVAEKVSGPCGSSSQLDFALPWCKKLSNALEHASLRLSPIFESAISRTSSQPLVGRSICSLAQRMSL